MKVRDPIRRMADALTRLANQDTMIDIPDIGRRDEIGVMSRAALVLRVSWQVSINKRSAPPSSRARSCSTPRTPTTAPAGGRVVLRHDAAEHKRQWQSAAARIVVRVATGARFEPIPEELPPQRRPHPLRTVSDGRSNARRRAVARLPALVVPQERRGLGFVGVQPVQARLRPPCFCATAGRGFASSIFRAR